MISNRLQFLPCILFSLSLSSTALAGSLVLTSSSKINARAHVSCISEESSAQAKTRKSDSETNPNKARSYFTEWLFGNNKNPTKSKVSFLWKPKTDRGPKVEIITTDTNHNLIAVRSVTRESVIVVSSASNSFTTESWTFILNFNLETVVATRVQSNYSGLRGEVLSYQCNFEDIEPTKTIDQQDAKYVG